MKRNSLYAVLLFFACLSSAHAQTMKWVPLQPGMSLDKCVCAANKKNNYQCFALQYTPAVSGTLTSYTTGFLVSCTSIGSAIVKNESCSMTNNVHEINGCSELGQVLINSSGNSGTPLNNKLEAGKPVYLHQVCLNIPEGESITVAEEELTDLTTSIDLGNGQFGTESPAFITQTFGRPRYDVARPTVWLDFKSTAAGDLVSQLDWSVKMEKEITKFVVEHGVDGIHFEPVVEVKADNPENELSGYQYLHRQAIAGINFYRLQCFTSDGQWEYSPVRIVNFAADKFEIRSWPSPVSELLNVFVSQAREPGRLELMDPTGKSVEEKHFPNGDSNHEFLVNRLVPGVYTIVVSSGKDRMTEKVVVVH